MIVITSLRIPFKEMELVVEKVQLTQTPIFQLTFSNKEDEQSYVLQKPLCVVLRLVAKFITL